MPHSSTLEAQDVVYQWGSKSILDNISLTLKPGTVTGLVGANGAGKSTLIRVFSGDLQLQSGSILVDDTSVYSLPCRALTFGVAAESYGYPLNMSVRRFISYWSTVLDVSHARVNELVEAYKLKDFYKLRLKKLSTGQRKRVQLAIAFMADAPILLLDEPFTGLDAVTTQITRDFIIQEKENEKSILLVTHLFSELQLLCLEAFALNQQHLTQLPEIKEEAYFSLLKASE